MANIKSAKKRVRVSATKHDRNRVVRAAVKTRIARARKLVDSGAESFVDDVKAAISAVDQAAERGILHRRNAARRKSRLMRAASKAAKLQADPEAAAQAAAEARAHAKGSGKSARSTTKTAAKTTTKATRKAK